MKNRNFSSQDLNALYNKARSTGKCHTQKEFAEIVGINKGVLSSLMSGAAPLTDGMYKRIESAAQSSGILQADIIDSTIQNAGGDIMGDNAQKNLSPSGIEPLISEMAAQREMYASHIDRLLGIIEKMQK